MITVSCIMMIEKEHKVLTSLFVSLFTSSHSMPRDAIPPILNVPTVLLFQLHMSLAFSGGERVLPICLVMVRQRDRLRLYDMPVWKFT